MSGRGHGTDRWTDLQLLNTSVQHIETVAFKLMETVRGEGLMQRQHQTGWGREGGVGKGGVGKGGVGKGGVGKGGVGNVGLERVESGGAGLERVGSESQNRVKGG